MSYSALRWRCDPSGEDCLIVTLDVADAPWRLTSQLADWLTSQSLTGVIDIVPGVTTLGIYYQPGVLWSLDSQLSPYSQMYNRLENLLNSWQPASQHHPREVVIPVCYHPEFAPDLQEIAEHCRLTPQQVIARHQAVTVDVMMLGFLPGHPYLGLLDPCFAMPRKSAPRLSVPQGAIGIANRQSVIYPQQSPGGWNLIGRTPLSMFSTHRPEPCLLQAGDRVRFSAISRQQFTKLQQESQRGD
ncbi:MULTISPECIES: 5-oxoprolinase subunit PxpB [unclassified Tatumella]|uniref:5-oxoprolinase subunit PxpB n=1 Tax=unclassified Tatumella TaxID=2649542 RepID=UPI001BAF8F9D|nr:MULTISPECIES: 5-oxoprolinase subunit PxpB [unclassified Tatumella]MBS0877547.1 5-oxoprolinase subunit PxpB [Tatumella sp. JGM82]MBS0891100.1 5-oxoprolinase subunit PxpB [Tatumella sp. JGM94]MBS0902079.1 5-oxoprolinase subunit PxpB [Tatumella sp. JGM100]